MNKREKMAAALRRDLAKVGIFAPIEKTRALVDRGVVPREFRSIFEED